MAGKKQYLYAVQRASGHEVVSVKVDGATPPVEAQHLDNGLVRLVRDGDVIATSDSVFADPDEELTLYRWEAAKKLDKPLDAKKVKRTSEE
jgi:hypothetical protein